MGLQIASSTISEANQTAVPSLIRSSIGAKPGDKLIWQLEPGKKTAKIKVAPQDWGNYLSGLGKEVWKGVDVDKYIKQGRRDRKTR